MKKRLIVCLFVFPVIFLLIYSGCKKPPPYTTPPLIAVYGPNPYYLSMDSTYIEFGALARDDKDGDISNLVSITGGDAITTLSRATFYVTYKVTNSTGYTSTVVRTVKVVNNADSLVGRYLEKDVCFLNGNYNDSSRIDVLTTNDQIKITNFGGFGKNVVIYGTLQHLIDTIYFSPNQSLGSGKSLVSAYGYVYNADTSFFDSTALVRNIRIQYTWSVGGNQDSCTAVYSNKTN